MRMLASLTLAVTFISAASVDNARCNTTADCYLNGVCLSSGKCSCNKGWTGVHCGQFDFLPTPPGPTGGKAFPPEDDRSCWGSSVIQGKDGKFHMYSSGILGKCGLAVWAPNAALTHAVSDSLVGIYHAEDVIMRGSNPQITQFDNELRLWHTLSGGQVGPGTKGYCANCTNGSTPYTCRKEEMPMAGGSPSDSGGSVMEHSPVSAKLIVANEPAGPWRDVEITCTGWNVGNDTRTGAIGSSCPHMSNPTAYYFPNGTTLLAYDWQQKGGKSVGFFLASAPDVSGPYTPVSGDWHKTTVTWEGSLACTDPFLWRDTQGNFHMVFHCRNWFGHPTIAGTSDAGGHAFSVDGLHWTLAPEPAWDLTVMHTDGTNTTFYHRERPQVYIDPTTGAPAALFNGVSLANANQPFPWQQQCPPHPSHIQVGWVSE